MSEKKKTELSEDELFEIFAGASNSNDSGQKRTAMVFCPQCNSKVPVKKWVNGGVICAMNHTVYDA